MFSQIFSAIRAAVMTGFQALGRAAMLPMRALDWLTRGRGGGGSGMPEAPPVAADGGEPNAGNDRELAMATGVQLANLMMTYAANSVIDDAPAQLPAELPPELRAWARGLSRDECETLVLADERGISAHIQGIFLLKGVRKVAPLPTAQWSREPSPATDDSSLDVIAAYAPAP